MHAESLYQHVYAARWSAALDTLHAAAPHLPDSPLLQHAAQTFVEAFFTTLETAEQADLEKLFLLHTGRLFQLPDHAFESLVVALVRCHTNHPEAAAGYARHCPNHPLCAALLQQLGVEKERGVAHEQQENLQLDITKPAGPQDHTISLFRSAQEAVFFRAVREVFATYLVYPNVALRAVLDYEALRDQLTPKERAFFFRGLIDCVVFDQHKDYRPCFFFELDSPLHDDAEQQQKDQYKDRILALAGQQLHRIRKHQRTPDVAAFVALLQQIAENVREGR